MNLNYLRYFKEVCKHGSITKAAKAVHVSQPSVTTAIKELEHEFGVQLFYRSSSKISLTPEGKEFLQLANQLLEDVDIFHSAASELSEHSEVTLRLGIPAVLGTLFLGKIVPGFEQLHPHIHLDIIEVPTVTGVHMLEESLLDCLIGIEGQNTKNICAEQLLFETELVLVTNKNNALAKEKRIERHMLIDQPFMVLSKGSYHFEVMSKNFCTAGYPPRIVLQSNQVSTIRHMLENNLASILLYKEVFANDPNLCSIPLAEPIPARIGVFWRKNSYVTAAMKAFISFAKQL